MARATSGGGIQGNKVVHVPQPKREPVTHPTDPGAVSRLGGAVGPGTPYKPLYYNNVSASTPVGPTNNLGQGPGANGRMVMKSGSQGTHGSTTSGVARPGASAKIFPGFR
jgi:hypothetical protein